LNHEQSLVINLPVGDPGGYTASDLSPSLSNNHGSSSGEHSGMKKATVFRTVLAGIAGGAVFAFTAFITFVLIGSGLDQRSGPLFDPARQSAKFLAVWTRIQPLPLFVTKPHLMLLGYVLFGVGHSFLFRSVAGQWPAGRLHRTCRLAFVTWGLSYLFFEFLGPFNLLGEPLPLVAMELAFWAVAALAEAATLVSIQEWRGEFHDDSKRSG